MKRIIIIAAAFLIALPLSLNAQRKQSERKSKERSSVSHARSDRASKAKRTVTRQRSDAATRKHIKTQRTESRTRAVSPSRSKREVTTNTPSRRRQINRPTQRSSRSEGTVRPSTRTRDRSKGISTSRRNQHIDRDHNARRNHSVNSSKDFRRRYYRSNYKRRINGHTHGHINHFYTNRRIARNHYHVYHKPSFHIYFRPAWFRFYVDYFPDYHITYSRELHMIPGNAAYRYIGEVKMVYGKVYETYYDPQNQEFFLYFGAPYPNQDFTVVVTGREAKRMERRQMRYYIGRDFSVAGLITTFDGVPEIVINDMDQLRRF